MLPPLPRPTETRLGTVTCASQLRLDARGTPDPAGNTVRKPPADWLTAVTLSTTAVALAGTAPTPPMARFKLPPLPSVLPLFLVSSRRLGVTAVYKLGGW